MTLLLAAKCKQGIVLMADGLCRNLCPDGKSTIRCTDYQKVFPFSNRPIAIARHGINELGDSPVGEHIRRIEDEGVHIPTVGGIADHVERSFDRLVRDSLTVRAGQCIGCGCGFWIAGYGSYDPVPALAEVFWEPDGGRSKMSFDILAEGGDGKVFTQRIRTQAPSFSFDRGAEGWSMPLWNDYLDRLYRRASRLPGASDIFGGERSTYWITAGGVRRLRNR